MIFSSSSAKLDKHDVLQYINRTRFGIHHSYRTANMEVNYLRHMAREGNIYIYISIYLSFMMAIFVNDLEIA